MKKLIFAASLAAIASGAFADEPAPAASPEAPKAVEANKAPRQRPAFDRAKFEERIKQRKAERAAKVLEAIKAAGLDDAKAKELAETIDKLYSRPPRAMRSPRAVKNGGKPAEQK